MEKIKASERLLKLDSERKKLLDERTRFAANMLIEKNRLSERVQKAESLNELEISCDAMMAFIRHSRRILSSHEQLANAVSALALSELGLKVDDFVFYIQPQTSVRGIPYYGQILFVSGADIGADGFLFVRTLDEHMRKSSVPAEHLARTMDEVSRG